MCALPTERRKRKRFTDHCRFATVSIICSLFSHASPDAHRSRYCRDYVTPSPTAVVSDSDPHMIAEQRTFTGNGMET